MQHQGCVFFFFFNDTATTEIYTLSLHDALPIFTAKAYLTAVGERIHGATPLADRPFTFDIVNDPSVNALDRKSTRLNSSHANISYAVFCLKKKKKSNRSSVLQSYLQT